MNAYEIKFLERRITKLNASIRDQYSLPKHKRDLRLIADAQARIQTVNGWLGKKAPKQKEQPTPQISKAQYRQEFREVFGIPEPEAIMEITDVETLEKVWPKIAGQNIQVKVDDKNPALLKRLKELVKEHHKSTRPKGHR